MQTLIIHDDTGIIISTALGVPTPREPVGIPFIWADVPTGKHAIAVDVSSNPHQVILEDLPKSEVDVLKEENAELKNSIADLWELVLLGGAE